MVAALMLAMLAMLAGLAAAQRASGATGKPIEQSSMVINFYNSGAW
jgi:hypothetical protein